MPNNRKLCLTSDCTDIVISCGGERGILHMSRFVCPGIHQECIEVADGTLTTPKKFSVIGDKCKLKDWKNALRIQGKPIRRLIDSGQLTFHNHSEQCTGRCMSGRVDTTDKPLAEQTTLVTTKHPEEPDTSSTSIDVHPSQSSSPGQYPERYQHSEEATARRSAPHMPMFPVGAASSIPANATTRSTRSAGSYPEEEFRHVQQVDYQNNVPNLRVQHHYTPFTPQTQSCQDGYSDACVLPVTEVKVEEVAPDSPVEMDDSASPIAMGVVKNIEKSAKGQQSTSGPISEGETLIHAIIDVGLTQNLFDEIMKKLEVMKHSMEKKSTHTNHCKLYQNLYQIVDQLGLTDDMQRKLAEQKAKIDKEKIRLQTEMDNLRHELHRRKEKCRELGRKTACFEKFVTPAVKRKKQ